MKRFMVCATAVLFLGGSLSGAPDLPYQTDFPPEEFQARWKYSVRQDRRPRHRHRAGGSQGQRFSAAAPVQRVLPPLRDRDSTRLSDPRWPGSPGDSIAPPRDARLESAEGKIISADDAELVKRLTGAKTVASTTSMTEDWMRQLIGGSITAIYTPFAPAEGNAQSRGELRSANNAILRDPWDGRPAREAHFVELLKSRFPKVEIRDLTPILDELRSVKSPREIALIRRASQLAGWGLIAAIKNTRPGVFEYQLDAVARYVFQVNGARLEGYRSITAGGTDNIWNMHYYRNADQLKSGDLVLMDFAPEYHYYTSDIAHVAGKRQV